MVQTVVARVTEEDARNNAGKPLLSSSAGGAIAVEDSTA